MRSASSASMIRPVSMSSQALEAPMSRGSSQLTPMSHPEMPSRTKATLNRAEAPAMRMSLARARANPPPAAAPLTAAITGCGMARRRGTKAAMWVWVAKVSSTRSAPVRAGRLPVPGEIDPCAEAPTGTGQDHDPARAVVRDGLESFMELSDEHGVHGVQSLWALQGDQCDALSGLIDDQCGHGTLLRSDGPSSPSGSARGEPSALEAPMQRLCAPGRPAWRAARFGARV